MTNIVINDVPSVFKGEVPFMSFLAKDKNGIDKTRKK